MFKKEYLILFAIIISASLYLYLKDKDRVNYRLPEPALLAKADIEKIEINLPQSDAITLEKAEGHWQISPAGYAADETLTKEMVGGISKITLTALVSDSKDYDRYHLAQENTILVTARSKDDAVVRELAVGKMAASGNHTFVRIGQDPSVYHANGSLHDTFNKTLEDLRDKTVLAFDKAEIDSIAIAVAGENLELKKQAAPADEEDPATAAAAPVLDEETVIWETAGGQAIEQSAINGLLGALSSLKCDSYLAEEAEKDLTNADYQVTLTGKKTYMLALFSRFGEGETGYSGISSENPSAFQLSEYMAGLIMKKPADLLIEATE